MRTGAHILLGALVLLVACGKDEVDLSSLTNNPFDPDYTGPALFAYDTTYSESVPVFPAGSILYQVIEFDVDESLFLAPADYNVQVVDEGNNDATSTIGASPANSSHFIYRRPDPVIGAQLCLRLSLTNNGNTARAERICATLQ